MMLIKDFMALSKAEREQRKMPLDFSHQNINDLYGETLDAFCEALGQCYQVPEINLSENSLSTENLIGLQGALRKCKNLKSLILCNDAFTNAGHATLLGKIISQCSALESLDLSGARLGEDVGLAIKYCPKLKVLILRNNWYGWSLPTALGSLLAKACPQLQILDISENNTLPDPEINPLIVLNKNLYEIRSAIPLTSTQSRRLRSRFIQHNVERADKIATETGIPTTLALLTLEYDDTLSNNHFDEKTIPHIKEGLSRLLKLKHALAMKKGWDLAKIFSLTIASFVLTLTFASYLFPGLSLLMSTFGAATISSMVFKTYRNFIDRRTNALQSAAMTEPFVFGEGWFEQYHLEKAYDDGKESVKNWSPYLRHFLKKNEPLFNEYWDKGHVAGLIEANAPARATL